MQRASYSRELSKFTFFFGFPKANHASLRGAVACSLKTVSFSGKTEVVSRSQTFRARVWLRETKTEDRQSDMVSVTVQQIA